MSLKYVKYLSENENISKKEIIERTEVLRAML